MLIRDTNRRANRRANVATERVLTADRHDYFKPSDALYGQLILIALFTLVILMRMLH